MLKCNNRMVMRTLNTQAGDNTSCGRNKKLYKPDMSVSCTQSIQNRVTDIAGHF
jgi:hypothetical protein